jgi:hypothetical protein
MLRLTEGRAFVRVEFSAGAGDHLGDAQRAAGVEDPHAGGKHDTGGFQRLDEKVGYLLLE